MSHTPGPWEARAEDGSGAAGYWVVWAGNVGVADCFGEIKGGQTVERFQSPEEVAATARLIAAAPDLLAALEYIVGWNPSEWNGERARELALAAIAKAKGGAA